MFRSWMLAFAFAASAAFAQDKGAPAPQAGPVAGTIDFVQGDAMVENGAASRLATEGDSVHVGETITTFPQAELHLKMADGAYYSLREYSKMTITKYQANGDENDEALIDLARGALRSITGWIGKYRREADVIRTPMVTIGVRGTDHEVMHLLPGDPRGDPGTYDKVNEGATVMTSPQGGKVEIQPNRAAFFNASRPGAPRLLASVPKFFRPAPHEARFVERAQASARTLGAQRDSRRKQRGLPPGKPPAQGKRASQERPRAQAAQKNIQRAQERPRMQPRQLERRQAEPRRMAEPRRTEPQPRRMAEPRRSPGRYRKK